MTITLNVEGRVETGKKLKALRQNGKLPAVVYGHGEDSLSLTIDKKEFEKVLKETGESSILILSGLPEEKQVLIHDLSYEATKGQLNHVDFLIVRKGQEVTVNVPLQFINEAPAIKLGGVLTKALHELTVTGKSAHLPHEIEVDLSALAVIGSHIRVGDLKIPTGLKIENDIDETVVVVNEVKEEIIDEAVTAEEVLAAPADTTESK